VKAYIAATQVQEVRAHGRGALQARLPAHLGEEGGSGARVLPALIKGLPELEVHPDAYLSFAEFYFDKGEMDAALKFYEKVEQFPKSSVYPYAVYKKGWCYVNLGDFKTALETFVAVVRMTQEGKVNVNAPRRGAREGGKKTSSRPTPTWAGPTRPGSSSSARAATSRRR
jgi:tetratricopeptide (TPR) repeat protein